MKKGGIIITAVFFLMAAALGWFLPLAVYNFEDRLSEGKQESLNIEQINLSYRDDLAMNQKINLVNYETAITTYIELDKGISNQKADIERIMNEFLTDFTGIKSQTGFGTNAQPMLANLANNRGTIVIWVVDCKITDEWSLTCYVDDRTGAILRSNIYAGNGLWTDLVDGVEQYSDPSKSIAERYSNALYNHYQRQLSAKLVTYHMLSESPEEMGVSYRLVFRDGKNYTFQVTVEVSYIYTTIQTY